MGTSLRPLSAIAALALASCASTSGHPIEQQREVVYRSAGDTELRLHVFSPPGHRSGDSRGAIVFFFGGGWRSGTPTQFFPHCEHLAERGMVAMSAEYRVESRDGTTPVECVQDGRAAVRWIREHARALGVDPARVAAGGGSAGGHVAAATATVVAFESEAESPRTRCVPDALVLFNPVFDNGPEGYGYDRVKDYWQDISPLHNLDAGTPPTIVFLGTQDRLIPVATAEAYRARMEALGGRCDLHLYEGKGHGFFNESSSPESFVDTVAKMDAFLDSLGFLELEP
ncbi:Acetylxylan esterase precursor [Planctomycetes bacterium Poly30]|uniref:Acetylxylan esterase n=1 Tax=Saltatorellus ferox TaxID=2528018 RepID=A0A518EYF8_9BACT|nr:Acetylxylan esterase precursor [Planctomycetes bacterium Poly30]